MKRLLFNVLNCLNVSPSQDFKLFRSRIGVVVAVVDVVVACVLPARNERDINVT